MIIECSNCGTKNRVPDSAAMGVKYRCASCGQFIEMSNLKVNSKDEDDAKRDNLAYQQLREKVFQKIEMWKKRLLDLTRRNRLLFFKASRTTTVNIIFPSVEEIFNLLIVKGHSMIFPIPKRERQLLLEGISTSNSKEAIKDDFKPGDLEVDAPVRELQVKLYRIRREWKTWQEEQGVHTLFLAVGMLHWYESEDSQDECLAPLILIPVGLEKEGLEKPYTIHFIDEDIVINPALSHKLEIDYGIHIPEVPEDPDWVQINKIFDEVTRHIPDRWDITDELWLARFSFDKLVMYKDLEEQKEKAIAHPIVTALAKAVNMPDPIDIPETHDTDKSVDPYDVFPVLDADSSQLEVLIRARAGQNLVVQGPPGTGKSQTIANLIAQTLRDRKKVLFVSEKMAALEVVFRRLKEIGLSFACLEVHSHRSNKSKVIEELGKTLQHSLEISIPSDAAERFNRLVRRRELLNQYVKELHKPRGALKFTAYKAHGLLAKYSNAPSINFNLPISQAQQATFENLDNWISSIQRLSEISEVWNNFSRHPWVGANIDPTLYTIEQRDMLLEIVTQLYSFVQKIKAIVGSTSLTLGLKKPDCLENSEKLLEILKVLSDCRLIADIWLKKDAITLSKYIDQASEAEQHAIRLACETKAFSIKFKENVLALPIGSMLTRFKMRYRTIFRWMKKEYWEEIKKLKVYWISNHRMSYRSMLRGLEAASLIISERNWFKENEHRMAEAFGKLYKGAASNWEVIRSGIKWVDCLISVLPAGRVSDEIVHLAVDVQNLQEAVGQPLTDLSNLFKSTERPLNELRKIYQNYKIHGQEIQKAPFDIMLDWLYSKTRADALDDWIGFLRRRTACGKLGLEGFISAAIEAGLKANQLENVFLKRFWKAWVSETHRDTPSLNEFRSQAHENIIDEFRTLDRELKDVSARLIQCEIQNQQPKRGKSYAGKSQRGILLREVQKRRRHRPLRRLFTEIPDLLQALKPCLLMSPLSVAAYLGKSTCRFDLVIFDEASQIPSEDAVGAILRSNQLIVAGDNKQLPPTRFFQANIDIGDEEEEFDETPLESVLDDCLELPTGLLPSTLNWHYRSRHEELISFSNRRFYNNRLVTFPSPYPKGSTDALRFIYVPDGVYDRGGSRTNRIEAKKIVDLVSKHLRSGKGRSLGVITLSLAQEEAVLQEWEKRKAAEQDLANLIYEEGDEPFFIKALEKVQGDERDFIFISIGYGPDQNRIIQMQFGPINREGGERRLNVAVTRARYQTTVVCSMIPQDLDLTKLTTGHKGVLELQKYLEYAQQGGSFREESTSTGIPESDFEIAVKEVLESRGYKVDSQVGFSGFRIDLGVRHPDFPDRYILGIECDGATYHSHRTARDRDRLRQEVLTALGWKIHRIWSTDWIRDPDKALNLVIEKITDFRVRCVPGISAQPNQSKDKANNSARSSFEPTPSSTIESVLPKISTYKCFSATQKRPSQWLYDAERDQISRQKLTEDMLSIVNLESPIHFQALCSRVREIYSLLRTGARIQETIQRILSNNQKLFHRRGDFIWKSGDLKVEPRAPNPDEKLRPIEWVSVEELAAAAEWLLRAEFGMPRESLVKGIARLMGYDRTGVNVQERINEAIDLLIRKGRVNEANDQIVLVQGD